MGSPKSRPFDWDRVSEAACERETFAEPVRERLWFKDFCPKMVASAVDVLESVIEEMRKNENSQH